MRISDWSSDVCSSDLPKGALLAHRGSDLRIAARFTRRNSAESLPHRLLESRALHINGQIFRPPRLMRQGNHASGQSCKRRITRATIRFGKAAAQVAFILIEIGRASCRERECQYV